MRKYDGTGCDKHPSSAFHWPSDNHSPIFDQSLLSHTDHEEVAAATACLVSLVTGGLVMCLLTVEVLIEGIMNPRELKVWFQLCVTQA